MKKNTLPALALAALGVVLAVGSQTFIGACVHEDGSFGACHWAARMLLGVGALVALLGVLALAFNHERPGLYLSAAAASVVGLLTPGTLISICGGATMRCRMVMRPAAMVLCGVMLIAACVGWLLSRGGREAS